MHAVIARLCGSWCWCWCRGQNRSWSRHVVWRRILWRFQRASRTPSSASMALREVREGSALSLRKATLLASGHARVVRSVCRFEGVVYELLRPEPQHLYIGLNALRRDYSHTRYDDLWHLPCQFQRDTTHTNALIHQLRNNHQRITPE
ncbi:hypothetical protein BDV98DRAFT_563573 [Pterulicium gracile]|uniref:Uncharacterized protein n=1 Tax=Pterulicium gracile TaxID=1884261 RepID=A0A5C3QQI0_9AGAR|nr:hypothetical protein BDV98DRAFT_563573 [Pterula gracilis]